MFKIDKKRIVVYGAVIGLLVFLYFIGLLRPIENLITKILNPVFSGFHSVSSDMRLSFSEQTSKKELLQEIKRLEKQVINLTEENVGFKTIAEENEILREHLGFLTRNEHKYIISSVISRGSIADTSGHTETIVIDKGLSDGVYPGLGVVSSQGIIVGKIIKSKDHTSKVNLTNSNKCKLAATVLGEEKTSGAVEGELGLTVKMNFIPQNKEILIGDMIITSGLEQSIPRGLIIGRVIEVEKESNELWQAATIEPMIDPEELIIVSVLLP